MSIRAPTPALPTIRLAGGDICPSPGIQCAGASPHLARPRPNPPRPARLTRSNLHLTNVGDEVTAKPHRISASDAGKRRIRLKGRRTSASGAGESRAGPRPRRTHSSGAGRTETVPRRSALRPGTSRTRRHGARAQTWHEPDAQARGPAARPASRPLKPRPYGRACAPAETGNQPGESTRPPAFGGLMGVGLAPAALD
jgi:hypothetical protein